MTDNEIKKALEKWCDNNCKKACPQLKICDKCVVTYIKSALNLINRQKAEVDRLKCKVNRLERYDEERDIRLHARLTEEARAKAIKEFAERLKHTIHQSVYQYWNTPDGGYYLAEDVDDDIDNLVKEMTVNYESSTNDKQRKEDKKND